ncbi:IS66-like element accessory protein TnpA [Falsiroseomonas sp. HW251]|uniref:IS66-like element accessory protein TnpA n=1 Tax=Falsiroseomonas sp. HW251 TaxID=3390998 RepID=UPI003D320CDD
MELRADIMVDISDDTGDGGYRCVELLTGPGRRRKWSDDDKARIVDETLQPGTVVADVAQRWQVSSQQVFTWRREMRRGAVAPPAFVPIVAEAPAPAPEPMTASARTTPTIEIKLAGAVMRVGAGTDADLLTTVLRAIRASAA